MVVTIGETRNDLTKILNNNHCSVLFLVSIIQHISRRKLGAKCTSYTIDNYGKPWWSPLNNKG